jgi:hypothetical protein
MSTEYAVTMQELELEHAELLPARETLCSYQPCHGYGSSFTQSNGDNFQNGLINVGNVNFAVVL